MLVLFSLEIRLVVCLFGKIGRIKNIDLGIKTFEVNENL
uniref:Uncharacterized protein n=1 Tax=Arabidopsis thaliana TaxID=3702 RepID=Q56YK0_ARATH|nr:hypothetical protein [Arabidopsis thaliana]